MGNKNSNIHHSPMKITKKKFIWTIENFSAREEETEEFFKSGEFSSFSPSGNQLKWQLKIYPKGQNEAKDHVAIYIFLIDSAIASSQISAKAEFCIRAKGLYRAKNVTQYNKFTKNGTGWGFRKFIQRDLILNETNCPNDLLTIVCEVHVRSEKIIDDEDKEKFKIPACRMVKDIGNLFEKNQYTDCLIKADDGKEFMVHKCILAGRSSVFAVMFKNQLVDEVDSNILKIDKIKSEVLEQLFRFIYSGEAPKMKEMAKDLLAAADKFELERLKMLCESHLVESLEKGNACELLVLASCNSAEYLKTKAIEYIKMHGIKVKESNGWEMLAKEHLQLFE